MGISIEVNEAPQINLDPKTPPIDPKVVNQRATMAHYGLGDNSPGLEQILSDMSNGMEDELRSRVAASKDLQIWKEKQAMLRERAQSGELTPDEALSLTTPSKPTNPSTVLEDSFANRLVNDVASQNHALDPTSDATYDTLDQATWMASRQAIARTVLEDIQSKQQSMGWGSWGLDVAEQMIPFKSWINTHNAVAAAKASGLQGTDIEEQYQYLLSLPPDEFQVQLKSAVDSIAQYNTQDAVMFANGVLGMSGTDKTLYNAFGIMDIFSLGGAMSAVGKGIAKGLAVGAAKSVTKEAGKDAFTEIVKETVQNPIPWIDFYGKRYTGKSGERHFDVLEQIRNDIESGKIKPNAEDGHTKALLLQELENMDERNFGTSNKGYTDPQLAKSLSDTLKATAEVKVAPETIASASGDLDKAATVQAFKTVKDKIRPQDPFHRSTDLFNSVPTFINPKGVHPLAEASPRTTRIVQSLEASRDLLLGGITDINKLNRTTDSAILRAIELTKRRLTNQFNEVNHSILDTIVYTNDQNLGNVWTVEAHIGNPDGTYFKSPSEGFQFAEHGLKLQPDQYRVKQQGNGFYIQMIKDVSETDSPVRDVLFETGKNETPRSLVSMIPFIGYLRTPEDVLDTLSRQNRGAAVHGQEQLQRIAGQVAKEITDVGKKDLKKLQRILEENRNARIVNPNDPNDVLIGKFHETIDEFENAWQKHYGNYPSEKVTTAYFKYVQLNDWDYIMRNLGIYRDKARQGIENYRFPLVQQDPDGREVLKSSQYFDGKHVNHIPTQTENPENSGIAIYDSKSNTWEYFSRDRASDDQRALLNKRVNEDGFRIIQVANPAAKPLMEMSKLEDTINFVVVKNFTNKPLDYQQLPYRGGGHKIYDQQWFVKQPIIRRKAEESGITRHYYEGDTAMTVHYTEAEAKKYATAIEKGRQLLDRPKELAAHLAKTLPYRVDQFMDFFKEGGKFHPQDPFTYTRSGLGTNDVFRNTGKDLKNKYENFEDLVDSTYNLFKDVNKKLAGQKDEDLPTILENTTPNNPLALGSPQLLDPYAASANALGEIARNRFLEDYKYQSMNQWLEEFKDVLAKPIDEMRANPVYHFTHPEYNELAIDKEALAAAKNSHMATSEFVKLETPVSNAVNRLESKLMDSIYNKMGQGASNTAAQFIKPADRDPFLYARKIVTNTKLGLFALPQLFVQSQALAVMAAITGNPLRSAKAQAGAFLMRHAIRQGHPDIANGLGKVATKLGWTEKDFAESLSHLASTGYQHVGGDIAFLADYGTPKFFKSSQIGKGTSWFFDKGMMFFKMAEGNNRLVAWNTAFLEFKKANPTKVIGSRERNQILQRAKNLNLNMTRESNSRIQKGIFSVPTQFAAYNMRLAEALLSFGKADRLTLAEKARLLTVNSLMYGVPVGTLSAIAPVFPWYDDIKEYMFSKGIDPNSGWLEAVMEGLPSLMLEQLTGNEYNYGTRFGPNSLDVFNNIAKGDPHLADILFGPSADTLPQLGNGVWTVGADVLGVFSHGQQQLPIFIADMKDALSTISSFNLGSKVLATLNLGRYVTKNEMQLSETDGWDSLLMGMGLTPREIQDAFIKADFVSHTARSKEMFKTEAIKWIRRAIKEEDEPSREAYLKRAKVMVQAGGFLPTEMPKIFSDAMNGNETFVNMIRRKFPNSVRPEDYNAVLDAATQEMNKYNEKN